MKKILIHTEDIKKQGAKVQFQIKLPKATKEVTGILITATPTEIRKEDRPSPIHYSGWINLRIPDKRDVFYSELVSFSNHIEELKINLPRIGLGIGDQNKWWFNGTKREFFKIRVPIENTLIEGYYEDHSTKEIQTYTLRVYLSTEIVNK